MKGFTGIEMAICVVIAAMLTLIVINGFGDQKDSPISWGFNGMTEVRCIDGFKHTVGDGGQARQILDAQGRGVTCN